MTQKIQSTTLSSTQMATALKEGGFFKLICGGSFTHLQVIERLVSIYSQAGCDCIDIAPDKVVLETVLKALSALEGDHPKPDVMVSVPLDPDPHFRKIELLEPDCILCGACVPICPTDAIAMEPEQLLIDQPRCYGCNRCVDICPTTALHLNPFLIEKDISDMLSIQGVAAVEIHTGFADPVMLEAFIRQYQSGLENKWVALCFRPDEVLEENWLASVRVLNTFFENRCLLQIDGKPMSGSDDPQASLPSIMAAKTVHDILKREHLEIPMTISGGINAFTAEYLRLPEHQFIRGAGMGTMARKLVWDCIEKEDCTEGDLNKTIKQTKKMIVLFKNNKKSSIIENKDT